MMRRQEQGFTLLELSISGAILLLLVSAIYGVLSRTTSSANDLMRMGLIQENGRRVLDGLAREIREADGAAIVITTTPDGSKAINFRVPTKYVTLPVVWSTPIQY
jgi:prepilin-type N-terminal cleavage/methylation domain-containing protein